MRVFCVLGLVAVALLAGCMGEGQTDVEFALTPTDSDADYNLGENVTTSPDLTELIFTYPDGTELVISASYSGSSGRLYHDCFHPDEPISVSGIEGKPRDASLHLSLVPCED